MLTVGSVARRLAPHPDEDADAGFSMAEMLVTIVILGVIGSMLSTWFIAGIKSTSKTVARTTDQNAVHGAMLALQQDVEFAVPDPTSSTAGIGPFVLAKHDYLSMYTRINGLSNPTFVKWYINSGGGYNGTLVRAATPPSVSGTTVTWPSTGTVTRNMVAGVNDKNDGKIPVIFRLLDDTNAAIPQMCTDATPAPSPCATPLSGDPVTVPTSGTGVEVYLQVATAGDGVSATTSPYYESSPKTGAPYVVRARYYPQINTSS